MTPRTITVAGQPVRLYPPPTPGRAFPWVEFEDLLLAADFAPGSIATWAQLWQADYPERSHVLSDGRLIVPCESALGLFEAARQHGWDRAERAIGDYHEGSGLFFIALNADVHGDAFRAAVNEAVLRAAVTGEVSN